MPNPSSFPPWLRRLGQLAGSQPPLCNGDNCACLVIPRAERGGCREVSAAASHLQDPSVPRPPPRPGPRPGAPGLTERRWLLSASRAPAALLRQPGRGWQPASAGRTREPGSRSGGGRVAEGAPVALPSARCWGRPLRRAARQELASAVVGRAKATLSLRSPPACFLSRGGSGDSLPGKLRGSFPGLLAPPQFSAPSPWLGSRCWPAQGRRLWQPEPGGGGGRRSHWSLTRPTM